MRPPPADVCPQGLFERGLDAGGLQACIRSRRTTLPNRRRVVANPALVAQ